MGVETCGMRTCRGLDDEDSRLWGYEESVKVALKDMQTSG